MIVQFGTSRFLQAHVDLFASEAREAGQSVPGIVIVQTTDDPARARRLAGFADPAGFPVMLRGMADGKRIERTVMVRSVCRGIAAKTDWPALVALVRDEATHIVSNTGDTGYRITDADRGAPEDERAPAHFCAMLVALLHHRWQAGRAGLTMLPCELVAGNGDALRALVSGLASVQRRDPRFVAWLEDECAWANTLVDRIVSAPLEPAGAIAEPYALWAIERGPGLALPFTHPSIVVTEALEPFERLKLHILNLGHSWLAEHWHRAGARGNATVREAMADAATRTGLERVFAEEVVPGFVARAMAAEARAYVVTTLERFANPFLDHRLADIYQNHDAKLKKRVAEFVAWVDGADAAPPPMTELRALANRVEAAA